MTRYNRKDIIGYTNGRRDLCKECLDSEIGSIEEGWSIISKEDCDNDPRMKDIIKCDGQDCPNVIYEKE